MHKKVIDGAEIWATDVEEYTNDPLNKVYGFDETHESIMMTVSAGLVLLIVIAVIITLAYIW